MVRWWRRVKKDQSYISLLYTYGEIFYAARDLAPRLPYVGLHEGEAHWICSSGILLSVLRCSYREAVDEDEINLLRLAYPDWADRIPPQFRE